MRVVGRPAALLAALLAGLVLATGPAAAATARNVILVIGDGMGYDHVLAARLSRGSPKVPLAMEGLPVLGSMSTYAAGAEPITDSAASATAMATGHKTTNGRIATLPDGRPAPTLFESLQARGYALGIVTDGDLNGATAAAFTAHVDDRDEKAEIARQMLRLRPEFLLGASAEFFDDGVSQDDARRRGYHVAVNAALDSLRQVAGPLIAGYTETVREDASLASGRNVLGAPSLVSGVRLALERLESPFVLLIEGDWIDSWSHDHQFERLAESVLDLDAGVAAAADFARRDGGTLLVVTADHECGGLTLPVMTADRLVPHFSTEDHTASNVPVYALGPGSERFAGALDNTDIYHLLLEAVGAGASRAGPGAPRPAMPY